MKRYLWFIVLFIVMLDSCPVFGQRATSTDSLANVFQWQPAQTRVDIQPLVSFWEDTTGQLPLAEVVDRPFSAMPRKNWMEKSTTTARSRFWMRFSMDNTCDKDTLRLLFFPGMHSRTELYSHVEQGAVLRATGGLLVAGPPATGQIDPYGLPLEVPPGRSATYLVSISNFFKIYDQVRAELFNPATYRAYCAAYHERQLPFLLFLGFIIGGVTTLSVFGLIQFLLTRGKAYLWYAFFALANSLNFLRVLEMYADVRWVSNFVPHFHTYVLALFSASAFSYLLFIWHFLDFRAQKNTRSRWIGTAILIAGLVFVLTLAGTVSGTITVLFPDRLAIWFNIVHFMLFAPAFLILFFLTRMQGELPRFVILGTLSLLVGGAFSIYMNQLIDQKPIHEMSILECPSLWHGTFILLENLCFALGLGYKTRLLEREKRFAEIEKERENERLRNRIAQDIHDEVGGRLTKISLAAQLAVRLPDLGAVELKARLTQLGADARQAAGGLREIVFAINPDYDRFSEMQAYFRETAREFWSGTGVEPQFDFPEPEGGDPNVPPDVKRQLLLIFKEAMNNVAKHAGATAVFLALKMTARGKFCLEVKDNGQGFVPNQGDKLSNGLPGMRKRATSIGLVLAISSEPGAGTLIRIVGSL